MTRLLTSSPVEHRLFSLTLPVPVSVSCRGLKEVLGIGDRLASGELHVVGSFQRPLGTEPRAGGDYKQHSNTPSSRQPSWVGGNLWVLAQLTTYPVASRPGTWPGCFILILTLTLAFLK